jgi:hypothetical protein
MADVKNTVDLQKAWDLIGAKIGVYATQCASNAEAQAKDEAPWTDRTGDARKNLKGFVITPDNNGTVRIDTGSGKNGVGGEANVAEGYGFLLSHRVSYGKWLETANNGKYAVLEPVGKNWQKTFQAGVQKILAGGNP